MAAQADTPGCVSRAEFRRIHDGMTVRKVHGIFDTRGHQTTTGSAGQSREYRTCAGDPSWSYAEVDFDGGKVWFKWIYISR